MATTHPNNSLPNSDDGLYDGGWVPFGDGEPPAVSMASSPATGSPATGSPATGSPATGSQTTGSQTTGSGTTNSAEAVAASKAPKKIDWRTVRPDGSHGGLQRMLETIGKAFSGEVMLSYEHAGKISQTHLSCENAGSNLVAMASSATLEASRSAAACLYSTDQGSNSALLASLREQRNAALALSIGCAKEVDKPSGLVTRCGLVLLVLDRQHVQGSEDYKQLLAEVQAELPNWLHTWRLAMLGRRLDRWQQRLQLLRGRRGKIAVGIAVCCVLLCWLPVPYRPKRECVIEPALRTFVASPIAGRITSSRVRPGDRVVRGQVLARLNDEDLRWKLASLQADYEAAGKRRDTALASGASGELRLAQLEQERILAEIESLNEQLGQLELRSPRAGVIVQGDWYQSEGAPVEHGQTLFEIGDLETMRIETRLTTDDLAHVAVGQSARVHVAAADGESWNGTLSRIDARGQTIDDQVVFVADMQVENLQMHLRPGMKGSVRISAGSKSIGWLLFYRPYAWVCERLVW